MKWLIGVAFCMCIIPAMAQAQEASSTRILTPDKYDEWGDITFNDEKTHLNKIASQAKEWSLSIVYVVIHAGRTACVGEAKARGVRAKNYLMSRGVADERIIWIDAGWRRSGSDSSVNEEWKWSLVKSSGSGYRHY